MNKRQDFVKILFWFTNFLCEECESDHVAALVLQSRSATLPSEKFRGRAVFQTTLQTYTGDGTERPLRDRVLQWALCTITTKNIRLCASTTALKFRLRYCVRVSLPQTDFPLIGKEEQAQDKASTATTTLS
ncbi:MAG: hypothetical protein KME30_20920 [Iphinoe sp. HA4291-MV1]|jgi:hypothetical protein|nr:hypothetical protein [Iphinoe sp. HA4291-MV1]